MDVDRFQAVGSRWPTSLPTITVHLQRGPETTHRKWDQPGPALPTLLLAQQVHEWSSQRSSLSPRLMHLLQMLLNVWATSCRPMLNPQQDQSSSKENRTFGDKLITSEHFNPGESDNLSLLGLKHILGMGLSFPLFKSSLSFCILTSPPNSYLHTLSPAHIRHFVVLQFTTRCRYCIFFFTNWRFAATLTWACLSVPFSNSVCSLCVSVSHFDNSRNISDFFIMIIFVLVICDQWSLMLLLQKDRGSEGSDDG